MKDDFYSLLGVDKNASDEEIKKAYRKKAMELHPDRHGGDKTKEAEFKKINEAYSVLSDSQKKAHYDRFGSTEGMGGFGQGGFGGGMDFDISDIFESFFGGNFSSNSRKKQSANGEDIEINVNLDFGDAIFGTKKTIKFDKKIICENCSGTGAKPGTTSKTCSTCHGTGQVRKRTQSFFGVIEQATTCPDCHGTGQIIESPCNVCNGKKRVVKKIEKEIDIPAGIDDEMTIKLRGEGSEGVSGKAGDLYISFRVPEEFEGLKREGDNLFYNLSIDPVEAILGLKKKVKIPLIGERIIEIKAGTQHGEILKFKGDGVKNINHDTKGDLFITLEILIPKNPSKKEKELYELIAQEKGIEAGKKGLFW